MIITRAVEPVSHWDESRRETVERLLEEWLPEPSPNGYDAEYYAYLRASNAASRIPTEYALMECPDKVFSALSKSAVRGHMKTLHELLKKHFMRNSTEPSVLNDCVAFVPLLHKLGIRGESKISNLIFRLRDFKKVPLVDDFNDVPLSTRESIASLLWVYDAVTRSDLIEKISVSPVTFDRNDLTQFILDNPQDAREIAGLIIDHETLNVGALEYLLNRDGHSSLGTGAL